jgi:pSer/pThr/pTyr-binding forkhead associated (FHA) protein
MYKLVISDDEGKTIIVPLVRDLITVGRQDGNTIRLTERNVSRQHARFMREASGYRIEDLDSYNGITVNGVRIDASVDLKDGDRVGIGDYVIALRAEASSAAMARASTAARASVPLGFGAPPPARFVMISAPAPGAEFSVTKPALSIGRLEELDLCISHRSISREHARVTQKGGSFEIEDLRSANGVRVNGTGVKRSPLRSGDIVELGQVRFRFVGQGESYVYDPEEEQAALSPSAGRKGPRGQTIAAVVGAFVVACGMLAFCQDANRQAGAAGSKEVAAPPLVPTPDREDTARAPSTEVLPGDQSRLSQALETCREGLAGGRLDEASAAAEEGLALPGRLSGGTDELAACKRSVNDAQRAKSAYEEGKHALAESKTEDAYFLFAGIPDEHPLRNEPEVKATIGKVAQDRITRAKKLLKSAPAEAHDLAGSVLEMQGVAQPLRDEAQRIVDTEPPPVVATPAPTAPTARSVSAAPAAPAPATVARPRSAAAAVEPKAEDDDPAKVARNCLARGDQRCVVKALEGKAESAQELALLIETYRALGETKKAVKHMETFVARYATARQTPQYRQFIAKHEQ